MRYKSIKPLAEQSLFEINMSPTSLQKLASQINAKAGMEFEMIVPNAEGNDEGESEPDYDMDERCRSIEDIVNFFDDGDWNGRNEIRRLRERLYEQFQDWTYEEMGDRWIDQGRGYHREYFENNDWDAEAAREQAVDEIGDAFPDLDQESDEFQQKLRDRIEEIFDEQVEESWDSQDLTYDHAQEEFNDEQQGEFEEEDWLNEQGYRYMSDIANDYDVQWPHYTMGSNGGRPVQEIADEFSDAIGRPVNSSTSYHGARREEGTYVVEPDGSLHGDSDSDTGLEFVSPPLPISELLSDLKKVKKWADREGCYTGSEFGTGLHINVSVDGYSMEKLDYVKLALLMGDDHVLKEFERQSNTYCKGALTLVKDKIKQNPESAKELLDKMKEHMNTAASKSIHSGITNKFTSINTKDGYIEFRSPGGDWLNEFYDKIEPTLLRFVVALDAAIDENKYKQEYLKKLYKLIAPAGDKSTIEYFAKYVAGEIPKAALRSFVQQAQLQRKIAKDKLAPGKYWWNATAGGMGNRIEVVGKDEKDAKIEAAKAWGLQPVDSILRDIRVEVLRPYEEKPAKQQDGLRSYNIYNRDTGQTVKSFQARNDDEAEQERYAYSVHGDHGLDSTTAMHRYGVRFVPAPRQQGVTVSGRPNNPEGNWYLKNSDTNEIFYRFNAANYQDAHTVLQQWKQENPDSNINAVYGHGRDEPTQPGGGTYRITSTGGSLIAGDEYGDDQTALQRAQYWAQRRNVDVVVRNPQGQEVGRVSASGEITPTTQSATSTDQGNWGIWINANERFANQPGQYASREQAPLYRFPSREDAEQWIEQQRAARPNMRTDIEVREIEPAREPAGDINLFPEIEPTANRLVPHGPGPWELYNTSTGTVFRRLEHTNRAAAETEAETYYNLYSSTLGDISNFAVRTRQSTGEFSGEWKVLIDGEEVYRFSGAGNNQGDANRIGREWILGQIRQRQLNPRDGADIEVLPVTN